MNDSANTLSVSQVNNILATTIDRLYDLKNVWVEGEVSSVTYRGEHLYLYLKDQKTDDVIKVTCFFYKRWLNEKVSEGEKIRAFGSLNYYGKFGQIQILITKIEKQNEIGRLYEQLEKLRVYCRANGYFDESRKKKISGDIQNIAVVTSASGDAVRDIIKTIHERDNRVNIYVYDARVQGSGSELSIVSGIKYFNNQFELPLDCIVVGRGGGDILDLWAFNTKEVVDAIFESKIPIISAVGHQPDHLLSDDVADLRAATPSHVAQLIIPIKEEKIERLHDLKKRILNCLLVKSDEQKKDLINLKDKLSRIILNNIQIEKNALNTLKNNHYILKFNENVILDKQDEIISLKDRLNKNILNKIEDEKNILDKEKIKVSKFNITDTLDRGFSLTTVNGVMIKDVKVEKGMILDTMYKDNKHITSEVK